MKEYRVTFDPGSGLPKIVITPFLELRFTRLLGCQIYGAHDCGGVLKLASVAIYDLSHPDFNELKQELMLSRECVLDPSICTQLVWETLKVHANDYQCNIPDDIPFLWLTDDDPVSLCVRYLALSSPKELLQYICITQGQEQAILHLIQAAQRGHIGAQYRLAGYYHRGEGVQADIEEAFLYYNLAANRGHRDAQYELAKCYHKGLGIDRSLTKARVNYELAKGQGHPDAVIKLVELDDQETARRKKRMCAQKLDSRAYFLELQKYLGEEFPVELRETSIGRVKLHREFIAATHSRDKKGAIKRLIISKSKGILHSKGETKNSKRNWFKGVAKLIEWSGDADLQDGKELCLALAKNDSRRARETVIALCEANPGEGVSVDFDLSYLNLLYCTNLATKIIDDYIGITKQEPPFKLVRLLIELFPHAKYKDKVRSLSWPDDAAEDAAEDPAEDPAISPNSKASFLGLLRSKYFMSTANRESIRKAISEDPAEAARPS